MLACRVYLAQHSRQFWQSARRRASPAEPGKPRACKWRPPSCHACGGYRTDEMDTGGLAFEMLASDRRRQRDEVREALVDQDEEQEQELDLARVQGLQAAGEEGREEPVEREQGDEKEVECDEDGGGLENEAGSGADAAGADEWVQSGEESRRKRPKMCGGEGGTNGLAGIKGGDGAEGGVRDGQDESDGKQPCEGKQQGTVTLVAAHILPNGEQHGERDGEGEGRSVEGRRAGEAGTAQGHGWQGSVPSHASVASACQARQDGHGGPDDAGRVAPYLHGDTGAQSAGQQSAGHQQLDRMAAKLSAANSLVALSRRFRDTGAKGAGAGGLGGAARILPPGGSLDRWSPGASQVAEDGEGKQAPATNPPCSLSQSLESAVTGDAASDMHSKTAARKRSEQSRGREAGEGLDAAGAAAAALEAPQAEATARAPTEPQRPALSNKLALLPILTDAVPERPSSDKARREERSSPARPAAAAASDAAGSSSSWASSSAPATAGAQQLALPPSSPPATGMHVVYCVLRCGVPRISTPPPPRRVASHAPCPPTACCSPATSPSTRPAGARGSPGRASATREAGGAQAVGAAARGTRRST